MKEKAAKLMIDVDLSTDPQKFAVLTEAIQKAGATVLDATLKLKIAIPLLPGIPMAIIESKARSIFEAAKECGEVTYKDLEMPKIRVTV
jgi:hypothetical protein